jgi:hypothetical protein
MKTLLLTTIVLGFVAMLLLLDITHYRPDTGQSCFIAFFGFANLMLSYIYSLECKKQ